MIWGLSISPGNRKPADGLGGFFVSAMRYLFSTVDGSGARAYSACLIFSAWAFSISTSAIAPLCGFKGSPSLRGTMWKCR